MSTFHNKFQPRAARSTVYQLRADVLCPDGMKNAFSRIVGLVLPFVAKSLYVKLPPEAADLRSFELKDDDRQCECVSVPERMLWAIRFKFASKDGTRWYYDISLVREEECLLFGMKIDTAFKADIRALQANLPLVESLLGCGLLAQEPVAGQHAGGRCGAGRAFGKPAPDVAGDRHFRRELERMVLYPDRAQLSGQC